MKTKTQAPHGTTTTTTTTTTTNTRLPGDRNKGYTDNGDNNDEDNGMGERPWTTNTMMRGTADDDDHDDETHNRHQHRKR